MKGEYTRRYINEEILIMGDNEEKEIRDHI